MAKSRPRKNQSERSDLLCQPLTNRARGPYWGILALGHFCTDLAALGPYCRANIPQYGPRARLVRARLISHYSLVFFFYLILFPLPLSVQEYKMFNKISTVKEEVERAKYSKLIICPLIKYIYFRIKSKPERKELMHSK